LAAATATPSNRFRTDQKSKKKRGRNGRRLQTIPVSWKINSKDDYECPSIQKVNE
jgi:hypothetical protein